MKLSFPKVFSNMDWPLFTAAFLLTFLGLLLIRSTSDAGETLFFKQIIFWIISIVAFFVVRSFDRHFWRNASVVLYGLMLLLLLGVLFFGSVRQGTQGWFDLGVVSFQPAEFAKIICILFLATTLERLNFDISNWRHLVLMAFILGLPSFLIASQPDFGPVFIILATGGIMVFFTGLKKRQLLIIFLTLILLITSGWFGILRPYQKDRVLSFLNPQADPLGSGYNVRQSLVAIGSGGLWGRGLGEGTQSQLNFLPEQQTDFIFASLSEELGFVGALSVLILYLILFWRIYLLTKSGVDLFSGFLTLGIFTMFLIQSAINIGMNMGLLPVVGVTLPLVSYGGSSLLLSYISLGLVVGVKK